MILQRVMVCGLVFACCSYSEGALRHRYSFTSDATDSVGGANGMLVDNTGIASFSSGRVDLSGNDDFNSNQDFSNAATVGAFVDLPNGIISGAANAGGAGAVTVELWAQSETNRNWAALFSAGNSNDGEGTAVAGSNADYIQVIPRHGQEGNELRVTSHRRTIGPEGFVDYSTEMSTTQPTHIVAVFDQSGGLPGTVTMYVDGSLVGPANIPTDGVIGPLNLAAMERTVMDAGVVDGPGDVNVWLGRSQWGDPLFDGWVDEFRVYDHALSAGEVGASFRVGPNSLVPEPTSLALLMVAIGFAATARRRR